jgi:hypothetical protein
MPAPAECAPHALGAAWSYLAAEPESETAQLYRAWRAAPDDLDAASLADAITATSPTSVTDYAVKVLVANDGADWLGTWQEALVAEAAVIVTGNPDDFEGKAAASGARR